MPDGNLASGSSGEFDVFNATYGSLLSIIYADKWFTSKSFALLENGYLAAGGFIGDRTIEIWNISNSSKVKKIETGYSIGVLSLANIESGLLASSGMGQNKIEIWNVTSGPLERTL